MVSKEELIMSNSKLNLSITSKFNNNNQLLKDTSRSEIKVESNKIKNLLYGIIEIVYLIEDQIVVNRCLGLLIKTNIVTVSSNNFNKSILTNSSLNIRFIPYNAKYRKYFVNVIDYVFPENSEFGFLLLSNIIGDFLFLSDYSDEIYFKFSLNNFNKLKSRFFLISYNQINLKNNLDTDNLGQVDTYIINDRSIVLKNKLYLLISNNIKIENECFIFMQGYNLVNHFNINYNTISETEFKELLEENQSSFIKKLVNLLPCLIIEVDFLDSSQLEVIKTTIEECKNKFISEHGVMNYSNSYYVLLKKHFENKILPLINNDYKYFLDATKKLNLDIRYQDKVLLFKKVVIELTKNFDKLIIRNINNDNFHSIIESFYFCKFLSYLDISNNKINEENTIILCDFINFNKNLKSIILTKLKISSKDFKLIINGICNNENLVLVNMSENDLKTNSKDNLIIYDNEDEFMVLSKLKNIDRLESLYLYNVNIDQEVFCLVLNEMTTYLKDPDLDDKFINLNLINLSNNYFNESLIKCLGDFVAELKNISTVYLKNCKLNDNLIKILINILLMKRKSLSYLDLSDNNFYSKGCNNISFYLSFICNEIDNVDKEFSLILNNNKIMNDGIIKICEGIIENTIVFNLYLDNTGVDVISLEALHNKIIYKGKIKILSLKNNYIDDDVIYKSQFYKVFESGNKILLKELYLQNNRISAFGINLLIRNIDINYSFKLIADKIDYTKQKDLDVSYLQDDNKDNSNYSEYKTNEDKLIKEKLFKFVDFKAKKKKKNK